MRTFFTLTLILLMGALPNAVYAQACYSDEYVEISNVTFQNDQYSLVLMRRRDDRVKAKYFAARDYFGRSVYQRFQNWREMNDRVVLVSSGTYMDAFGNPEGLTIDNGVQVNGTLIRDRMDALAIVYPTGGIAVSNLNEGNLSLGCYPGRKFDLRGSARDLYDFKQCAEEMEATVFQTHLLVYDNQLEISTNADQTERERRFLAVGKNEDGEIVHLIVHRPAFASLYESSKKTLQFLNEFKYIDVIFMINLDTGNQDVFRLFNGNCSLNRSIQGPLDPSEAVNLLVYYFK